MFGILNFSWVGDLVALLIMTHITVIGVTVYYHRCLAHRALEVHPIIAHFFRLWVWMTTGMGTRPWVAIHRKHHSHCETENDPHSPQVLGLKKVLFEGAELYKKEAKNHETIQRYGKGTPDDWIERHIYAPHHALGIFILLTINIILFGLPGITMWAVQMMWIPFWAAGVVNGVGHYWGYRNFEVSDASTNISPIGLIMGGEELHNNHHSFPTSAKLSVKWWEFDIGWVYIRLFEMLGLAKVLRSVPELKEDHRKKSLDADTLCAVLSNRIQVMDRYCRSVILPVWRDVKQSATKSERGIIRLARKLMVRDDALMNANQRQQLESILSKKEQLKVIYDARSQLQEIWRRTTSSQAELLERLQEWCKAAEASGVKALQDFADHMRFYTSSKSEA